MSFLSTAICGFPAGADGSGIAAMFRACTTGPPFAAPKPAHGVHIRRPPVVRATQNDPSSTTRACRKRAPCFFAAKICSPIAHDPNGTAPLLFTKIDGVLTIGPGLDTSALRLHSNRRDQPARAVLCSSNHGWQLTSRVLTLVVASALYAAMVRAGVVSQNHVPRAGAGWRADDVRGGRGVGGGGGRDDIQTVSLDAIQRAEYTSRTRAVPSPSLPRRAVRADATAPSKRRPAEHRAARRPERRPHSCLVRVHRTTAVLVLGAWCLVLGTRLRCSLRGLPSHRHASQLHRAEPTRPAPHRTRAPSI